jgi:hypothetical protein
LAWLSSTSEIRLIAFFDRLVFFESFPSVARDVSVILFTTWFAHNHAKRLHNILPLHGDEIPAGRAELLREGCGKIRRDTQDGQVGVYGQQLTAQSRIILVIVGKDDRICHGPAGLSKNIHWTSAITHQFHVVLFRH